MTQQQNVRGVAVDSGARRMNDPVTVVVWPDGMEQDADTWSDANSYVSAGASIKDGYPTEPEMTLNPDGVAAPGNEPPDEPRTTSPSPTPATAAPRPSPPSSTATGSSGPA